MSSSLCPVNKSRRCSHSGAHQLPIGKMEQILFSVFSNNVDDDDDGDKIRLKLRPCPPENNA
jgi:hypothetical protein